MPPVLAPFASFFNQPQVSKFLIAVKRGEIAFALGLIAILTVLILPLPRLAMDAFLAISLTFSILILMTVLFIEKPLDFSSFPTVLLVATMLRLSLNVASTRLILTHGHEGTHAAGAVIQAFGSFVMGGNFVIGLIIFIILVLINFIVITKGSGRIAEVAARFSLDSMPGKQMAVDADVSNGYLTQAEAQKKRQQIQDESGFFGSMDGAAKFVRGDAIAGVIIAGINIFGGIIIGVAQQGLAFHQAACTYTLLTVGDGLVAQVPALIISVAAGMLVSKASSEGSTDKAFFGQLSAYPLALGISSCLMSSFALFPGMPPLPFLSLGIITGLASWHMFGAAEKAKMKQTPDQNPSADPDSASKEALQEALHIEAVRIELGFSLIQFVNDGNAPLLAHIRRVRRELATTIGMIVPTVHVIDNLALGAKEYRIRIKDVLVGKGSINPYALMALDGQGRPIECEGEEAIDPIFGMPARWISPIKRKEAEAAGHTVIDPPTVMATHLSEALKESLPDLLSYATVQELIEGLSKAHQKLFNDMVPTQLPPATFQKVLQFLLKERISIRDLPVILEGVAEAMIHTKNAMLITEKVRSCLSRQLCAAYTSAAGTLDTIVLGPEWEKNFQESLSGDLENRQLTMPPSQLQNFVDQLKIIFEKQEGRPVLLTSPMVRPYVRSVIERCRPSTVVMSQNEVHPRTQVTILDYL